MRYEELLRLAAQKNPQVLIEIGTHRGKRARSLAPLCRHYYGFDLWEAGNDETDLRERNGKGRSTMIDVLKLVGSQAELIQGDTRVTLQAFVNRGIKADFVFIDGGHSVETITSDFYWISKILNPKAVVVFDDFYEPEVPGFGCNTIIEKISHTLLDGDKQVDGTMVRLVKYVHP